MRFGRMERGQEARGKQEEVVRAENGWDALRQVGFQGDLSGAAGAALDEADRANRQGNAEPAHKVERMNGEPELTTTRQQRKIIAAMLYGNPGILGWPDAEINNDEKEQFLDQRAHEGYGQGEYRRLLSMIADPVTRIGYEGVWQKSIQGDKHKMKIMAAMTGRGLDRWQQGQAMDINAFMARYPLPMDFEQDSQRFVEMIAEHNPPKKAAEYEQAMNELKRGIYGKRQQYWDEMKALDAEAATKGEKVPEGPFERMDAGEAEEMMREAQVDGGDFLVNGMRYRLTVDNLRDCGMAPEYKVNVGGREIGLSNTFMAFSRESAIGYVETDEGVKVRGFYRSRSSGLWRYLPDYIGNQDKPVDWYGKGATREAEESLNLPMEMQRALSQIMKEQDGGMGPRRIDDKVTASYLIAGTAKRYGSEAEYHRRAIEGTLEGDFYKETNKWPVMEYVSQTGERTPPEKLNVRPEMQPNFDKEVGEWTTKTKLYGELAAKCYESNDGNLRWTFYQNDKGQAWVAGIETTSPITSEGVHSEWVLGGDLTTPLYEYVKQSGGYGDLEEEGPGNYTSMWKNYLSKAPVIKEFVKKNRR